MIPIWMMKYTFAGFFVVGMIVMGVLVFLRRKQYEMPVWKVLVFDLLLSAVGIAGVRLLAIIEHFDALIQGAVAGGMSFFGAVLLVPLLLPLLTRPLGLGFADTNDLSAPCVAGMVGCERINCFLSGCCGGRVIHLSGLEFTPRTQLIELVLDFATMIFLMLWLRKDPERRKGSGYPMFLLCYCTYRFLLEFIRDTEKNWIGMSHGQVFALIGLAFAGWYFYRRHQKTTARTA